MHRLYLAGCSFETGLIINNCLRNLVCLKTQVIGTILKYQLGFRCHPCHLLGNLSLTLAIEVINHIQFIIRLNPPLAECSPQSLPNTITTVNLVDSQLNHKIMIQSDLSRYTQPIGLKSINNLLLMLLLYQRNH